MSQVRERMKGDETQASLAIAIGSSEATVTRLLNEHLDKLAAVLAHLGLKVVPQEFKCVDSAAFEFLTATHARVMRDAPSLIWDQAE